MHGEDLDKPGVDAEAMAPYWDRVTSILGGEHTMKESDAFLPQLPEETMEDYEFRKSIAKFTNVFEDVVEALASRPFAKELRFAETPKDARFTELAENVDGQGNHMHVFAGELFFTSIAYAVGWIAVEYTLAKKVNTREEEKKAGARPYWVHVPATAVLDAKTARIQGREQLVYLRVCEKKEKQILIYVRQETGVVSWARYLKNKDGEWEIKIDDNGVPEQGIISIGVVPYVPYFVGRRKGQTFVVKPPMQNCADLQVKLFQSESNHEFIKYMAAFPMLAGNGVNPAMEGNKPQRVPVGPRSVLYAPPNSDGNHGEWNWIQPEAANMEYLAKDIDTQIKNIREVGRQPLTAQSGNLTKITTLFAAQKGNSAVQAWALGLKDALENAWKLTALWLKSAEEPVVHVHTDFAIDEENAVATSALLDMWKGTQTREPAISAETLREEMKRRNILSSDFEEDEEAVRLLDESSTEPLDQPEEGSTGAEGGNLLEDAQLRGSNDE